ncbi:MAG: ABC transporter permease [Clostridia bacterium]|nr:ABC transporter permease [Clostridia bacterium]
MITRIWINFKKYSYLLKQLVSRDFKVKYKRSVLGVLWSLLYPVLMMAVMAIVFTNMFKFKVEGMSYLVYLLSGLIMFNYFSEATNLAMSSVVGNFSLLNKVYIPKYIFPLSKCLFVGINFLLTLIPLYVVIFVESFKYPIMIYGLRYHFLLPYAYVCLFLFALGMGLILSTVAVFLRDMFYIYGIIILIWTYLTPIMYDIDFIQAPVFKMILKFNPLYQYINFARTIILHGWIPTAGQFLGCAASAIGTLVLGVLIFKLKQDRFIYYV